MRGIACLGCLIFSVAFGEEDFGYAVDFSNDGFLACLFYESDK